VTSSARLFDVAGRCPVHKLMTSVDVEITTKAGWRSAVHDEPLHLER
jgi:hypothetical protein